MSIKILLVIIGLMFLCHWSLKLLARLGHIKDKGPLYGTLRQVFYILPQVYGFIMFTYWVTDTRRDWFWVTLLYGLIVTILSVYLKFFFMKRMSPLYGGLSFLICFPLHLLASGKMLYIVPFWVFMTFYLIHIINRKSEKGFFRISLVLYLVLFVTFTGVEGIIDIRNQTKPMTSAKEYISHHYTSDDDRYTTYGNFFELDQPIHITVWQNFDDQGRELVELIYYKGEIFHHEEGTIKDFKRRIIKENRD